jgi:hypothetical protein
MSTSRSLPQALGPAASRVSPAIALALSAATTYVLAAAYHDGYIRGLGSDASLHPMPAHEAPLHFALGLLSLVASFFATFDSSLEAWAFIITLALASIGAVLLPEGMRWLDQRFQYPRAQVRQRLRSRMPPQLRALMDRGLRYFATLVAVLLLCLLAAWTVANIVLAFEGAGRSRADEELQPNRASTFIRATWTDAAGMGHEGDQLTCSATTLVCAVREKDVTHTVPVNQLTRSVGAPR